MFHKKSGFCETSPDLGTFCLISTKTDLHWNRELKLVVLSIMNPNKRTKNFWVIKGRYESKYEIPRWATPKLHRYVFYIVYRKNNYQAY